MNEGNREWSREEIRALAREVLDALGVEKADLDDEEREILRRAVEDWRRRKKERAAGEGDSVNCQ